MSPSLCDLADANDISLSGGKAVALATMIAVGFPVPPGFVVTTAAPTLKPVLTAAILDRFDSLGAAFVAVRSSAVAEDSDTAAWAGQFDTFLNTSRDELLANIARCQQSGLSARAQSYARQRSLDGGTVACIVQAMVQGDVSGVAFSAHPVTGKTDQIVIEAALGLGEAVVSGEVTPDTYVLNTANLRPLEKYIAKQAKKLIRGADGETAWQQAGTAGGRQKLSEEQLSRLGSTVKKLEALFHRLVDVEWAFAGNELYILQCRPITTLAQ